MGEDALEESFCPGSCACALLRFFLMLYAALADAGLVAEVQISVIMVAVGASRLFRLSVAVAARPTALLLRLVAVAARRLLPGTGGL